RDEIHAEVILKATKVDGVYSADPVKDPSAERYTQLSYIDVLKKNLKVMDSTAISLCMDNDLPIIVFDLGVRGNILRVVRGEEVGTTVGTLKPRAACGGTAWSCQRPSSRTCVAAAERPSTLGSETCRRR